MKSSIRALLTNPNFVLLWCAYGISAMGDHLSEFAILATQNALSPDVDITPLQARMTFVFMLPFFVLGALAGALADRLPRRSIMIGADLIRAAVMVSFLYLIGSCTDAFGSRWGPYIPLGLVGVFAAVFSPARQAMVPMLVKTEELVPANALIGGLGMIGTMAAAVFSGELAGRRMVGAAFTIDACTFVASAMCLFLISRRWNPISEQTAARSEPFFASVWEGVRYVAAHRRVAQLIGIAVVFWFSGATVRSVIPAVVKDVYGGGFPEMARFPAWIGSGLAVGALLIALLGRAARSELAITWCLYGAGIGTLGMMTSVFVGIHPGAAHVLGAVSIFVAGVFGAGLTASYNALLQRIVPDRYRGRVFGVLTMATVGGLLVASGTLAIPQWEHLDRWSGLILGGIGVLLVVVGLLTFRVRTRDLPFHPMYAFWRNVIEFVARFWWRLRQEGRCRIPHRGPVIFTANHVCPIDPMLVYATCNYREISFMIAAEYYRIPLVWRIVQRARCIPVRRGENDVKATKTALRRLRDGNALGIFVQGGIRHREQTDQLKHGVAMLALRTGAKVIPAHISGVEERSSMLRSFLGRHEARIAFGPAVDLSDFSGQKGQAALAAATERIFAAINALAPGAEESC